MNKKRFVKPAGGLRVRKPDGRILSADGAWVEWSGYWMRRLAEGSVIPANPPKPKKTKTKEE